jgi:hypothetical protein
MTIKQQFEKMQPAEHAELKERLLNLAESGAPKPSVRTLEGYALREYTYAFETFWQNANELMKRMFFQNADLFTMMLYEKAII